MLSTDKSIQQVCKSLHAAHAQARAFVSETKVTVWALLRRPALNVQERTVEHCAKEVLSVSADWKDPVQIHLECLHVSMQTGDV